MSELSGFKVAMNTIYTKKGFVLQQKSLEKNLEKEIITRLQSRMFSKKISRPRFVGVVGEGSRKHMKP